MPEDDRQRPSRPPKSDRRRRDASSAFTAIPSKGRIALLGCAVLVTIALGIGAKLQMDRLAVERTALDRQALVAGLWAEQVNSTLVAAGGALAAGAEGLAVNPAAALRGANQSRGVVGAVAFDAQGRVLAVSGANAESAGRAALQASGQAPAWAGVVRPRGQEPRAALTRRQDGATLVALIDPAALLAPDALAAAALLTDSTGATLARGAGAPAGASAPEAFGIPDPGQAAPSDRVFGRDAEGRRLAVGIGQATGGIRVYAAAPAALSLSHLLDALALFALMTVAPALATSGALWLHSRRQTARAIEAEHKLDQVQRHFRVAAKGARAGAWTWRREEDVIELSAPLQQMLSAPSELLSLQDFIALAPEDDRNALHMAFAQARDTGQLFVAFRIVGHGKVLFVEAHGVAIEDGADGAGVMVGTALDVSARREAELRSQTLERRLREAVESFSGPFALFDQRKRLVMWNKSFAQLFQLPETLQRRAVAYDALMTAAQSAIRRENHEGAVSESREIELHSGVWLQLVERRTMEGGLLLLGIDITPLKRQEEALIQKERNLRKLIAELERSEGRNKELAKKYEEETIKAQEANRAKTSFLANMSHELRTPLNAVIGFSDMMAKEVFGALGHQRYREYAKDIQASGELLLDMINDILDTAKIEAGRMQLAFKPIDPIEPIDQAVRILRGRAEQKKILLKVDAEDMPAEITADFRAIKQIVLNLLSNALKFTDTGMVMVRARPLGDDQIAIQVIDTGVGIPPAHLPRLGTPFAQVDAELSRKHGGTGLGLSITKSLAELHGGSMAIESEVGRGTTVTVTLPVVAVAATEALAAE